jgi:hypothetical protein
MGKGVDTPAHLQYPQHSEGHFDQPGQKKWEPYERGAIFGLIALGPCAEKCYPRNQAEDKEVFKRPDTESSQEQDLVDPRECVRVPRVLAGYEDCVKEEFTGAEKQNDRE